MCRELTVVRARMGFWDSGEEAVAVTQTNMMAVVWAKF